MRDAQELHKRIEELSGAIALQEAVLRGLERQKSDAQSDLNTILDPMAKLPFEISSEILLESLPSTSSMQASTALLGVCRRWRDIALATLSLWTHICNNGLPNRFRGLVEMWLPRSQDYPLVLSLHRMDLTPFTDLIHAMGDHARRIRDLHLVHPGMGFHSSLEYPPETPLIPLPWLQSLSVEGPPKELDIGSVNSWYYALRSLPNLIHSSLQHLYLGELAEWDHAAEALRQLALPSLRTLHIRKSYETGRCLDKLREFLIRSSPPLRSLHIALPSGMHNDTLAECLRLVPHLEDLTIPDCPSTDFTALFHNLSQPDILPALTHLSVHGTRAISSSKY
ncbi:hypothetical protein FB45DRAFT_1130085 [Roridomyces roridus]|uniref:F-box domain-containing protein n=1 Tax=Roridomyces roridus TaxID=1738132 RepID=A0AAD7FB11_9AGAR|nr:hypothetical protein FB45DRAFT_1130085 [Roridomyces roridus]